MERSSVDLPQAFAPTIAVILPGGTDEVEALDDGAVAVREREVLGGEGVVGGHSEPPERFVRTIR